jgi:nucleolar pre-ribosomal-associated protein 2
LQLEKGSAGPATQLKQAAQILGIDLALCASHPELNRDLSSQLASAPKEVWVLRWLLKKLKTKSYRVNPTCFILLQQLIHRIPMKTLAATLNEYKFLTVLNDVVKDLEDDTLASLRDAASGLERSGSESSHTLGGSPIQEKNADANGQSKKRKRTESAESNGSSSEQLPSLDSPFSAFIGVLDCLYSLTRLANKRGNVDQVARSHLRQALRAEPVFVAGLLGKSMKLSAYLIVEFSRTGRTTDLHHLLHVTPAILDLWDLRSERQDDSDNNSSNVNQNHFRPYKLSANYFNSPRSPRIASSKL